MAFQYNLNISVHGSLDYNICKPRLSKRMEMDFRLFQYNSRSFWNILKQRYYR